MSDAGRDDWYARLAATMVDVAERAGALATRVGEHWPDEPGRERAERLVLLQRSLHREAEAAHRLASAPDRSDQDAAPPPLPGTAPGHAVSRVRGARLPGSDAERVDDEPGMRLPGT